MQKWEYKTIHRKRDIPVAADKKSLYFDIGVWNPKDMNVELEALGREGWELVSITPRSSQASWGAHSSSTPGWFPITGGVTTDELWVFKRPLG
jgi:hypothetical protein